MVNIKNLHKRKNYDTDTGTSFEKEIFMANRWIESKWFDFTTISIFGVVIAAFFKPYYDEYSNQPEPLPEDDNKIEGVVSHYKISEGSEVKLIHSASSMFNGFSMTEKVELIEIPHEDMPNANRDGSVYCVKATTVVAGKPSVELDCDF